MMESILFSDEAALQAFSKQSIYFDAADQMNPVIACWRKTIYEHVNEFLNPEDSILELNSGTGIDAVHFASQGHRVHATDGAEGMIREIQKKITSQDHKGLLTTERVSFNQLSEVKGKFDYIFSNFGGLNCTNDLAPVGESISALLKPKGHLTWVIMPPFCPWELTWIFKGRLKMAFRRFVKGGSIAHLEGHYFKTYYHSISKIEKALEKDFEILKTEGIGILSPPPASIHFVKKFPQLTSFLQDTESRVRGQYPFNRWGDHLVVTFKKRS